MRFPKAKNREFAGRNNSDQGSWNTHTAGARSTFWISGISATDPNRLGAAVTYADSDVLLAVRCVRNRGVARHIAETRFPQQFTRLVVVSTKKPIDRTVEDHTIKTFT
jgi:hypothetical protein